MRERETEREGYEVFLKIERRDCINSTSQKKKTKQNKKLGPFLSCNSKKILLKAPLLFHST